MLPAGSGNTALVHVIIRIRDKMNGATEVEIATPSVVLDLTDIDLFIRTIHAPSANNDITPSESLLAKLLKYGNSDIVTQVIAIVSQALNKMNNESINLSVESKQ